MNATEYVFPKNEKNDTDGITLRDYFAIRALPYLMGYHPNTLLGQTEAAQLAYSYADAMLAARNRKS